MQQYELFKKNLSQTELNLLSDKYREIFIQEEQKQAGGQDKLYGAEK